MLNGPRCLCAVGRVCFVYWLGQKSVWRANDYFTVYAGFLFVPVT